ncbi:hypothetical protein VFPPC_17508 [Pochonia chlamydosporia 170]|uniref:Uncharacterized protein n=1 Tax=Pochonia chlamydosporia 170 TaxID=1380566 RepID=A0A219ARV7_METCM|nr:hypothetical protein VFPPC_17508 [Pochonia chlamydosporia 170]OWT43329.1 hypothetical protein VFPPC_17508 [Pochonia chlamydosporia 170]
MQDTYRVSIPHQHATLRRPSNVPCKTCSPAFHSRNRLDGPGPRPVRIDTSQKISRGLHCDPAVAIMQDEKIGCISWALSPMLVSCGWTLSSVFYLVVPYCADADADAGRD